VRGSVCASMRVCECADVWMPVSFPCVRIHDNTLLHTIPQLIDTHTYTHTYTQDHMYLQFRPEFLRKFYHVPISSDVFSRWGIDDACQHNTEAREAFDYLHHKTVPGVCLYACIFALYHASAFVYICICESVRMCAIALSELYLHIHILMCMVILISACVSVCVYRVRRIPEERN
jgi:hypothetical protein